jgi:hypothetical protein
MHPQGSDAQAGVLVSREEESFWQYPCLPCQSAAALCTHTTTKPPRIFEPPFAPPPCRGHQHNNFMPFCRTDDQTVRFCFARLKGCLALIISCGPRYTGHPNLEICKLHETPWHHTKCTAQALASYRPATDLVSSYQLLSCIVPDHRLSPYHSIATSSNLPLPVTRGPTLIPDRYDIRYFCSHKVVTNPQGPPSLTNAALLIRA